MSQYVGLAMVAALTGCGLVSDADEFRRDGPTSEPLKRIYTALAEEVASPRACYLSLHPSQRLHLV
ncbi:hypothetical protein J2T60_001207 [Natronospira proteinivora]|uniref:Uncharacterized protein n=1 Tax=Natronospira proteinivora TaxID=1807133 RepID=A0ABT1G861_9GAMM|nr:hypothetical protein [Natronospira proteinivora]MCP1727242.1 hypothetical protein [Natronospira proteinivora]